MPIQTIKNRSYGIADKPTLDKIYELIKTSNEYSQYNSIIMPFESQDTLYAGDIVSVTRDGKVRNISYMTEPLYVLGVVTKTAPVGTVNVLLEGSTIIEMTPSIRRILNMEIFPNSRSSDSMQMVVSNFKHENLDSPIKPYCIYTPVYNDDTKCKLTIFNPYTRDIYYLYNNTMGGGAV